MARSALLNARSALLNAQDEEQLLTWLGHARGHRLRPVFDTGTHGFNGPQFHSLCDNIGPTISIMQFNNGQLFGGYNPGTWAGNGWVQDPTNAVFLFRLRTAGNWAPLQCSYAKSPGHQLHCKNSYGPTWGASHDLCFWHTENVANGNSNVGSTYSVPNDGSAAHGLAGQNNGWQSFAPRCEVLVIEEAAPNHLLPHPREQVDWSAGV